MLRPPPRKTHETTPNMNDTPEETESTGTENSREAALPSSPSSWELGRSQQRQRAAATTRGETNTQPTDLAASSTFELQHGPRPMTIRAIPSRADRSKFGRRGVCVWEGWVEWGGGWRWGRRESRDREGGWEMKGGREGGGEGCMPKKRRSGLGGSEGGGWKAGRMERSESGVQGWAQGCTDTK